ncbi:transporter [Miniphocaeibacter massiliensis]|uniref:transporter n=1 Tax=Miniphocaeibacter massiliensis TaxID=2041841 RepID=UPI000C075C20|nr:transporter [Miniphocaeibacter massiliensis]
MRIDHVIFNINEKYQKDTEIINQIKDTGLLYAPEKGKKTKGFKVSNLFIGKEYLEFVNILQEDDSGWRKEWVDLYNDNYKGCTCIMLDIPKLKEIKKKLEELKIDSIEEEKVSFKIFGLFTITQPWTNLYLPFFENENIQIGFQQYDKPNYLEKMSKRMVPNSTENGITGISSIVLQGNWTTKDFKLLSFVFYDYIEDDRNRLVIKLNERQKLIFEKADRLNVEIYVTNNRSIAKTVRVENSQIIAADRVEKEEF